MENIDTAFFPFFFFFLSRSRFRLIHQGREVENAGSLHNNTGFTKQKYHRELQDEQIVTWD